MPVLNFRSRDIFDTDVCSADGALLYQVTKQDSAARKVIITKTSTRLENDPLGTIEMRYPDDNICECLGSDMNISRDGLGAYVPSALTFCQ